MCFFRDFFSSQSINLRWWTIWVFGKGCLSLEFQVKAVFSCLGGGDLC